MIYEQVTISNQPQNENEPRLNKNDDSQLVLRAKFGSSAAFEELYERHHGRLYQTMFRILRQREDAEDAVQRSFQRAFMNLKRFREESRFSTWLTRIAINEALMFLRQNRTTRRLSELNREGTEDPIILNLPDGSPSPEEAATEKERKIALALGISSLRKSLRSAIVLRELEELSTEETAKRLGLSVAAVKARVFHARRHLRKSLERRLRCTRRRRLSGSASRIHAPWIDVLRPNLQRP